VVGGTKLILSLGVITKGKGSKERVSTEGTGGRENICESESEPHGSATLLRCNFPAVVTSLSEKSLLQKFSLFSIPAESVLQDIQLFLPIPESLRVDNIV
jgi:hypothetical protein